MSPLPRDKGLDHTLALLSDGYTFVTKRCDRYGSDIFKTRLMLQDTICMMGEEAAQEFYKGDRLTRRGAIPPTALWLLQDQGSVATLDDKAHHWRKQMFMSLMTPESIQQLVDITAKYWDSAISNWEGMDHVVLLEEVQEILCRAVCQWTGTPLTESDAKQRTREFAAMIDGAGAIGPRNWRGMLLRTRTERWIQNLITQVRNGKQNVAEDSALYIIAWHRDLEGNMLDPHVAAVELINLLRPTVAVANYIVFAALALHNYPLCQTKLKDRLKTSDDDYLTWFVQEVRRFYPFFPVVGGRVKEEFEWREHHFAKGTWILLDLYGTNHDARIWQEPKAFQPERFRDWNGNPFSLIPQGGGNDYTLTHRCAGEWATIELLKRCVRLLTTAMQYDVPEQDLHINLSRFPAIPKSRFIIGNVKRIR